MHTHAPQTQNTINVVMAKGIRRQRPPPTHVRSAPKKQNNKRSRHSEFGRLRIHSSPYFRFFFIYLVRLFVHFALLFSSSSASSASMQSPLLSTSLSCVRTHGRCSISGLHSVPATFAIVYYFLFRLRPDNPCAIRVRFENGNSVTFADAQKSLERAQKTKMHTFFSSSVLN